MKYNTTNFLSLQFLAGYDVEAVLIYLTVLSFFTFILSIVLLPYLIRKIPSDYFLKLSESPPKAIHHDITHIFLYLLRNIFGFFLLLSGIAMLFLPGQGLITLFIALLLIDFPWKRSIIIRLIANKKIQRSIDWIRKKSQRPPIHWPPE